MKKGLCLIMTGVLCFSVQSTTVCAKESRGELLKERYYETRNVWNQVDITQTDDEAEAIYKYKKIKHIVDSKKEKGEKLDYYSGCYIDDDNNLVVMAEDKKEIKDEGVIGDYLVECDYSYDELYEAYEELNEMVDGYSESYQDDTISTENKKILNNIAEFYISVQDNRVIVSLLDVSDEETVAEIKSSVSNPSILEFIEGEESDDNATTLKLGRKIYIYNGNGLGSYASIGIKAYYINNDGDKVHGFITAGHATESVGEYVYISNDISKDPIGKVVKRKYSGKVDAAFVKVTNSDYSISRQVYYSNSKGNTSGGVKIKDNIYTCLSEGAIGENIYKAGSATYLTKGKLKSDSATMVVDGVAIRDLYKAGNATKAGDSGGVVFYHDKNGYQYLGIIKGHSGNSFLSVKWENIDNAWNIYFE